ncbi:MAG TPA: low affinity iron permease family protein [Gemmataceae bacterium]|nr:low affinity iron permease family protein [Gemmataceae bacterium]
MPQRRFESLSRRIEQLAYLTTEWTGSTMAFLFALLLLILWLVSGPIFHFSDTWQLVMNTVSSIVTFLMVFLIQRSQNKDALAMQIKLNELIAAQKGASNRLINVENLSESEVRALHERYQQLTTKTHNGSEKGRASSIEQVARPSSLPSQSKGG